MPDLVASPWISGELCDLAPSVGECPHSLLCGSDRHNWVELAVEGPQGNSRCSSKFSAVTTSTLSPALEDHTSRVVDRTGEDHGFSAPQSGTAAANMSG